MLETLKKSFELIKNICPKEAMGESMLTVFNVGQGDSLLFNPGPCLFSSIPILVDAGPRIRATSPLGTVASRLPLLPIFDVMITHAHSDHVGGLPEIVNASKASCHHQQIRNIYIPFYYSEIIKICSFLNRNYQKNNRIQKRLPPALKKRSFKIVPVCEGMKLCDHLEILNPPQDYKQIIFGSINRNVSVNELPNIEEIGGALRLLVDRKIIDENIVQLVENYESPISSYIENPESYNESAKGFIKTFFISLSVAIQQVGQAAYVQIINSHVKLTSNQASVVFRYENDHMKGNKTYLFTGDADEYVFDRIISNNQNKLKADVLKVPHHGSRGNISLGTLNKINPKYAIISHDNKHGHPHQEVIDLLDNKNIKVFYTNDVKRKGNSTPIRDKAVKQDAASGISFK